MSEAAEVVRAIDAISITLAERMALILREQPDLAINRAGLRWCFYAIAGIDRDDYADDEWRDADLRALSSELLRRFS